MKMWALCIVLVLTSHAYLMPVLGVECPARCRSCSRGVADCSGQSLTAPPRDYPNGTKELNLGNNYIRVLGARTFNNLPTLEVLHISSNKITSLRNDAFVNFPSLMTLDLTDNKITRVYRRSLRNMNNLRTLTLNRNKIRSLTRIFDNLPALYQLNLAKNRIRAIGKNDFSKVNRVHYIDLRNNQISSIHPEAFKELTKLRYLFLPHNPITSLPHMDWGSSVMQLLDMSHCQLTSVPTPLPASLGDLRLGHNQLTQIQHTDFINITDLKLLALNDNQLGFIGDGTFTHLEELKELWLRGNNLVYIPRGLPDTLEKLHMDYNSLQSIDVGLFGPNSRLDFLTVENNQISTIQPGAFDGLRFLVRLNLQGNRIQVLQERTFSNLGRLQDLLLSNNPLQRIDNEAFHELTSLTSLGVSHLSQENFTLASSFLPQMMRLQNLGLMVSPGLAKALMDLIADPQVTPQSLVLQNMRSIDVSYNTLEWISERVRRVFPNMVTFTLDSNPFRCTRRLKWLSDWMRSDNSVRFFNYEEPMCEKPYRLRGVALKEVGDNDWALESESDGIQPGYGRRQSRRELQSDSTGVHPEMEPAQPIIAESMIKGVAKNRKSVTKSKIIKDNKRRRKDKRRRKGKGKKDKNAKDRKKSRKVNKKRTKDKRRPKVKRNRRKRQAEDEFVNHFLKDVNDEDMPMASV